MDGARRRIIGAIAGALAFASHRSGASKPLARVAVLAGGGMIEEWRVEFARHGHVEGQQILLTLHDWGDDTAVLEDQARAIVAGRPQLICSVYTAPTLVLSRLTRDIAIVFFGAVDPDRVGLVDSLRAPGRNLTGVSNRFLETVGKRLELLRELRPSARALALVIRKGSLWGTPVREAIAQGASRLDLAVRDVVVAAKPDTGDLSEALRATRADAFLPTDVAFDPVSWARIQADAGIPGLFNSGVNVRAGGLLSVGVALRDQIGRGVAIAARILHGERPSRIPVDQAARIENVINLRTAEAFGWKVPPATQLHFTEIVK